MTQFMSDSVTVPQQSGGLAAAAAVRLGPGHRWAWLALAGLSLWIRSGFAIHAIGSAGLDDALFVRLARSLWGGGFGSGPFDDTTLVKGMGYPLFVLGAFMAGVPLKLAEQGVYLATAAGVALLVVRAGRQRWTGTILFAALALNPVFWTVELSRVIREGLYVSQSLAVVGLLVADDAADAAGPEPAGAAARPGRRLLLADPGGRRVAAAGAGLRRRAGLARRVRGRAGGGAGGSASPAPCRRCCWPGSVSPCRWAASWR